MYNFVSHTVYRNPVSLYGKDRSLRRGFGSCGLGLGFYYGTFLQKFIQRQEVNKLQVKFYMRA